MCASCGCQNETKTTVLNLQTGVQTAIDEREDAADRSHDHIHADGTQQRHSHDHAVHDHDYQHHNEHHGHGHDHHEHGGEIVSVETRILAKNDAQAAKNRAWLLGREALTLNLVSSPGSGKTTLLERTIAKLAGELPLFVIEGDQTTANDGERIRKAGAPVVQVNTGTGCHLDAEMVARGLFELKPVPGAVVFIENIGNLVCPALFDLGERAKVVIFAATEGEDKPLKYPHMFRAASLVILNKTDLLPHLEFSVDEAIVNIRRVNSDAAILQLSARTGEGLESWCTWIREQMAVTQQLAI